MMTKPLGILAVLKEAQRLGAHVPALTVYGLDTEHVRLFVAWLRMNDVSCAEPSLVGNHWAITIHFDTPPPPDKARQNTPTPNL
jgi:hypothetical protein